jgi:hypothetical protein
VRWECKRVPKPQVGQRVVAGVESGEVFIKAPGQGGFFKLPDPRRIPSGSVIDTRGGRIRITAEAPDGAIETAVFYDGLFRLEYESPYTVARLVEPLNCKKGKGKKKQARAAGPMAGASAGGRRLWGSGSGRFRTRGRRGSATVRGTTWLTRDRCESTFFRVTDGVGINVRDPGDEKKVVLGPGDKYTAR